MRERRPIRAIAAAAVYVVAAITIGAALWLLQPAPRPFGPGDPAIEAVALVVGACLGGWIVFETVRTRMSDRGGPVGESPE